MSLLLTWALLKLQNADLSDALMDRAVINQANLKNAILERVIFTRFAKLWGEVHVIRTALLMLSSGPVQE